MKIRVSTFFSIPTTGGKIVRTLSFNGVHVTLENKKIHIRPLPPSIPSLGVCCCCQVVRPAAQHCIDRMEEGELYFLILKSVHN